MRGGKRLGAGRKSLYGVKTKPIRVPEYMFDTIQDIIEKKLPLPLYEGRVSAGCPLPASDAIENRIDLSDYLVQNPKSTFLAKASGESMLKAGIHDGDLLVVDKNIDVSNGKIVVATLEGGLTVKRFVTNLGKQYLQPENDGYEAIELNSDSDVLILGVVTNVIHKLNK